MSSESRACAPQPPQRQNVRRSWAAHAAAPERSVLVGGAGRRWKAHGHAAAAGVAWPTAVGLSAGSLQEPPRRISRGGAQQCGGAAQSSGGLLSDRMERGDAPWGGRGAPARSAPICHLAGGSPGSGSLREPPPAAQHARPAGRPGGAGPPKGGSLNGPPRSHPGFSVGRSHAGQMWVPRRRPTPVSAHGPSARGGMSASGQA